MQKSQNYSTHQTIPIEGKYDKKADTPPKEESKLWGNTEANITRMQNG